jgi:transcriptional regulator with GAF, ATPase, and Fis domain
VTTEASIEARYQLEREIARDESCALIRAVRLRDSVRVLLKRPIAIPARPADIAGLVRERDVLAEIRCEGVLGAVELDEAILVLDDPGAVPLRSALSGAKGNLGTERVLGLSRSLARALGAVHAAGYSHRAIRAASILVGEDAPIAFLTDFRSATRLSETQAPTGSRATIASEVLSPEQTGRMNRSVDYRCDFYALGAVFYELATGSRPFETNDPLGLVHAHIAKVPASPKAVRGEVPEAYSDIVMKLLSKMAEDRYQSAEALLADLEEVIERRQGGQSGRPFLLGARERSSRFSVPQRLYGRERDVASLVAAFGRAQSDGPVFALVSGSAGSGKTAVVGELEREALLHGGRFLAGKFDQLERSAPYQALRQAFATLASEENALATEALVTLEPHAAVLASVIPELGNLLKTQKKAVHLGPAETENRLRAAVRSLFMALGAKERPLVLFLDDLQWADTATLRLLDSVLQGRGFSLLLVAAFRPSDVGNDDPVSRFRASIERTIPIFEIRLASLSVPELSELLSDTLRLERDALGPLAELVRDKTDGNPFFVRQFLRTLHDQGLLSWNRGAWTFDIDRVRAANVTDNVLDLMTAKLGHLGPDARAVLAIAACIGGTFSLGLLAEVRAQSRQVLAHELWESMIEGLVSPTSADYEIRLAAGAAEPGAIELRFSHDRVQQAAYALLPEAERLRAHLSIGRALRKRIASREVEIFDVAFHLNCARSLVTDALEREEVARINLAAGRRARERAAIQSASTFFRAGLGLTETTKPSELWATLSVEAAECEFVASQDAAAEERLDAVLRAHVSEALTVEAARVRVVRYENVGRFSEGISVATTALSALGVDVPQEATTRATALDHELARITELLGKRSYSALVELPSMSEQRATLAARLLAAAWPSAFLLNEQGLTGLLSALLVRLSVELGNTPESGFGYVTHAITVNARAGRYEAGNALARVGLTLSERQSNPQLDVRVQHLFGSFLAPFAEPLGRAQARAEATHVRALAHGDFTHAVRAAFLSTWYGLFGGVHLPQFEAQALSVMAIVQGVGHGVIEQATRITLQTCRAFRGSTESGESLSDAEFDATTLDAAFEKIPVFRGFLAVARLALSMHFGDPAAGRVHASVARAALAGSSETIWHHELDFYSGLMLVAGNEISPDDLAALDMVLERIVRRREACELNFGAHHLLLSAERARALGRRLAAQSLYAEAIAAADASAVLPDRALARELYGRAQFTWGTGGSGEMLSSAARVYEEWGASRKVRALESRYPGVIVKERPTHSFDVESTLRAAQAIAVEIEWEALIPTLLRLVIENAGADRGVLFELSDDRIGVVAEGTSSGTSTLFTKALPLDAFSEAPRALVEQVARTGATRLVADARNDERHREDAYVQRRGVRSVLAAPVVRQGKVAFVILLENALASDVFTEERVAVVGALAAHAAISLENARLYASMKAEVARRLEAESALKRAVDDLQALKNRLEAENVYLQEEIRSTHNFEEIIGNAPKLVEALERVEKVAGTDSTVLVLGETGTGKELIARAIHSRSPRKERPLVKVNCGAIPTGLVESELFGHVKGAFTGALARRVGRFELANGGTIFLDEVGELPLDTQTKLLRVLQEHEFEPVGSSKTALVDVRVIAATNRNLEEAVRAGRFRADLLYRLNVFPIHIPALRERREDIPVLVAFFVTRLSKKLGRPLQGFSQASMERLLAYPWPGNVRELENVVERASVFAEGPLLDAQFLATAESTPSAKRARGDSRTLEQMEREHIRSVLDSTAWVVEGPQGAATVLGLHPNTLRSRMKKLGIVRNGR